jgi:urease accessory protein
MRWRWAALSIAPSVTMAHTGTGLAGGFIAGFAHPFTGFDHLLAMVSVGLWGAFLGRPLIYVLPVVFPVVMVGGAVLGMFAMPVPSVEMGIALSVTVLGTCIALALRAPVWLAAVIVGAFAIFHGYAHGSELPSAADPAGYSSGFVLATGLLHLLGIGVGAVNRRLTRGLGGAIGAVGVWFIYRAVLGS